MLTVVSSPTGGGTVGISPPGVASSLGPKYEATDSIILTAAPKPGYVFVNWTGETDGIADTSQTLVTFVMGNKPDNNRTITANFAPSDLRYSVSAVAEPSGGGSVRFVPTQPSGGYMVNQSVSVRAIPEAGYVFSRWAGDLAHNENPRTLLVSGNKGITALFNATVSVYCSPTEGGSVDPSLSPNGYALGTEVTLKATAAKGYRFVSWEGDSSGSQGSIVITVDQPKTITAKFAEESESRWWLWALVGIGALLALLIVLRLIYARMNAAPLDQPPDLDE